MPKYSCNRIRKPFGRARAIFAAACCLSSGSVVLSSSSTKRHYAQVSSRDGRRVRAQKTDQRSVRDVEASQFIHAYAQHLKRSGTCPSARVP